MKFNIQTKLLIYILSTSLLIYIVTFGYLAYSGHNLSLNEAKELTDNYVEKYANDIKVEISSDMSIARTLCQSFYDYKNVFKSNNESVYNNMLINVLISNNQLYNSAINWELSAINENYKNNYGRIRYINYRAKGIINKRIDTLNLEGDEVESPYYDMKINPREDISEPYMFSSTNKKQDLVLVSSISIPILNEEKYVGLLQFDIDLVRFQDLVNEIRPFGNSTSFLISNNGTYIASTNTNLVNKKINQINEKNTFNNNIIEKIRKGEKHSYIKKDSTNTEYYISHYPVKIGKSNTYWSLGIAVPTKIMSKKANDNFLYSIIVAIIGFLLLVIIIWYISKGISKPLKFTSIIIEEMAKGTVTSKQKIKISGKDEIAEIHNSLNILIDGLEGNLKFALEIGKGNLDYDIKSLTKDDALSRALIEMRKSLKFAEQEEIKRKTTDKKLNWATTGEAKFAEVMRENTDKLTEFSYNVISNLVKYLNANQGGLFIINDINKEDVFVELSASYAYNKRKYIEKKIKMGVGLIGRCIKEAEIIYMTDFPDNYINLSSGLGQAPPKSLLLVPIIFNQKVFGVVEMASISKFEKFQIEFVKKIGENIGSTISNVQINERTARLLEESNIKSKKLVGQEERMRKKIDEMQETQDELKIQTVEFKSLKKALAKSALVAEFDMQGRLLDINANFLRVLKKTREDMVGTFQGVFTIHEEESSELFRNFWDDLRKGTARKSVKKIVINNRDVWIAESYTPLIDDNGKPFKVINISYDITQAMRNR